MVEFGQHLGEIRQALSGEIDSSWEEYNSARDDVTSKRYFAAILLKDFADYLAGEASEEVNQKFDSLLDKGRERFLKSAPGHFKSLRESTPVEGNSAASIAKDIFGEEE
jgi:hypothetical protein